MNTSFDKTNIKIIYAFILSNAIAYFVILIIPAKAAEENIYFLSLLNLLFINLILFFSIFTYIIYPKPSVAIKRNPINSSLLQKNIKFLSYAPIIGILLILFDRIILRGIDYSAGLRAARYDWLHSQGGNIVGIVGNLLVPFAYIAIFFLIVYFQRIQKKYRFILTISIILGIFGHAALNGGRSNLLLALVMIVIAFVFKQKGKQVTPTYRYSIKTKIIFLLLIYMTFAYVSYIIQSSAKLADVNLSELLPLAIESLYGVPDYSYFNSIHSELTYLGIYMLIYLFHGQWTVQMAYASPFREGSYATPPILYKLGIVDQSITDGNIFADTGAFISFPGALYYDFGYLGLILFSSLIGILLGLVFLMISHSKIIGGFKMTFIIAILYIILLSPLLPCYGLGYFNFILFAFVALGFINIFIFKHKINFIG